MIERVAVTVNRWVDRLRNPSDGVEWATASIICLLSAAYFFYCAIAADRPFIPVYHDEFMYLLEARMLTVGRLWMPPHPLGEFFDSFFVVTRPVYASTYFPGTAMLNVPGMWLGIPPWATALCALSLAMGLLYRVVRKMLDGLCGLLAVMLALSLRHLRAFGVTTMSHTVMLLMLLVVAWFFLRWRERRTLKWAVLFGSFAGWAAITRPLDAILLIGPFIAAVLWELRTVASGRAAITIAMMALPAIPFIAVQFAFDRAVTGHWLTTPIGQYGVTNFPGLSMGFRARPEATESPSPLPQVREYYRIFLRDDLQHQLDRGFFRTWIIKRFKAAADVCLPSAWLLVFMPLGLWGVRRSDLAALAGGLLLFPLALTFYPSYLDHYSLVLTPAFITLVLLGGEVLRKRFPATASLFFVLIAGTTIASVVTNDPQNDPFMRAPYLTDISEKLSKLPHMPAVVLFYYETGRTPVHEEPVFNIDTAWPDDATVIRAHDLGKENHRIFEYYANRTPQRFFYRYDRTTAELTPLGWARDLAAAK